MRSIKSHYFDDWLHDRIFNDDESVNKATTEKTTKYQNGRWVSSNTLVGGEDPNVSKDLFNTFFQKNVEFTENPNPVLKKFLDTAMETTDFKSMRDSTIGSDFLSYFAGKEMKEHFKEAFPELNETMKKAQEEGLDEFETGVLNDCMERDKIKIKSKIRRIAKEIGDEVQATKEFFKVAGYDLSDPKSAQTIEMKDKMKLTEKLLKNDKFKQIVEMIGRHMNTAQHTIKTSTLRGSNEIVGIQQGNSLLDVIPSELAMLQDPELSLMFVKKYSNASLIQWKMKGKETQSNGDIIIIMDQSGSMFGDLDMYSKSFVFGMWLMAKNTNKKLHVIPFASKCDYVQIESDRDCMDLLDKFMGGGTNYNLPLYTASTLIHNIAKKADVFFLTDGEGDLNPDCLTSFLEQKKKNGFKVLSVNLDRGENNVLKKFSDKIWNFDFTGGKESEKFLNEAFSSVI